MIYAVVLIAVVGTLCVVTFIKTLSVKNQTDFMVAGRKLPWPVLVFTLLSSWIGAGSLFAGAENAYKNGFASLWQGAGGWCGLIVIALIAGRARRFAQFTVPDLLEVRYNATARVMGTIAIVISYTVITSYQFKGGGDILHLIFPDSISRDQGMCIIAAFVILFTAAAGMASIAYLDLVIGSLVTVIVIIAVPSSAPESRRMGACQSGASRLAFSSAREPVSVAGIGIADPNDAAASGQSGHVPEVLFRAIGARRKVRSLRLDCRARCFSRRCWPRWR